MGRWQRWCTSIYRAKSLMFIANCIYILVHMKSNLIDWPNINHFNFLILICLVSCLHSTYQLICHLEFMFNSVSLLLNQIVYIWNLLPPNIVTNIILHCWLKRKLTIQIFFHCKKTSKISQIFQNARELILI